MRGTSNFLLDQMHFHVLSLNLGFIHIPHHKLNFLKIDKNDDNTTPVTSIGISIHIVLQECPSLCFCVLYISNLSLRGEYRDVFSFDSDFVQFLGGPL
jgi:hypothetical protein